MYKTLIALLGVPSSNAQRLAAATLREVQVCVCVVCVRACVCMCLQEQYLKGTYVHMSSHYVGLPLLLQPQMGVVSASIVDPALSLLRSLDLAVQHEGVCRGVRDTCAT